MAARATTISASDAKQALNNADRILAPLSVSPCVGDFCKLLATRLPSSDIDPGQFSIKMLELLRDVEKGGPNFINPRLHADAALLLDNFALRGNEILGSLFPTQPAFVAAAIRGLSRRVDLGEAPVVNLAPDDHLHASLPPRPDNFIDGEFSTGPDDASRTTSSLSQDQDSLVVIPERTVDAPQSTIKRMFNSAIQVGKSLTVYGSLAAGSIYCWMGALQSDPATKDLVQNDPGSKATGTSHLLGSYNSIGLALGVTATALGLGVLYRTGYLQKAIQTGAKIISWVYEASKKALVYGTLIGGSAYCWAGAISGNLVSKQTTSFAPVTIALSVQAAAFGLAALYAYLDVKNNFISHIRLAKQEANLKSKDRELKAALRWAERKFGYEVVDTGRVDAQGIPILEVVALSNAKKNMSVIAFYNFKDPEYYPSRGLGLMVKVLHQIQAAEDLEANPPFGGQPVDPNDPIAATKYLALSTHKSSISTAQTNIEEFMKELLEENTLVLKAHERLHWPLWIGTGLSFTAAFLSHIF